MHDDGQLMRYGIDEISRLIDQFEGFDFFTKLVSRAALENEWFRLKIALKDHPVFATASFTEFWPHFLAHYDIPIDFPSMCALVRCMATLVPDTSVCERGTTAALEAQSRVTAAAGITDLSFLDELLCIQLLGPPIEEFDPKTVYEGYPATLNRISLSR